MLKGKHSSELFADAVIDFLQNHDRNKPFFAYVAYTTPHAPLQAPDFLIDKYFDTRRSIYKLPSWQINMVETARRCGASSKFAGSGGAVIGVLVEIVGEGLGIEIRVADELGASKIALGHHRDPGNQQAVGSPVGDDRDRGGAVSPSRRAGSRRHGNPA